MGSLKHLNSQLQLKIRTLEATCCGHVIRPKHVTKVKRRAQRLEGSNNWFKGQNQGQMSTNAMPNHTSRNRKVIQPTESILFIPYAPNSSLKKVLTSLERQINNKLGGLELLKELVPLFRISCAIGHHGPKKVPKVRLQAL